MYTLKLVSGKYEVYKAKELIAKVQTVGSLHTLCNLFAVNIKRDELDAAVDFMQKNNHNVAEFGVNGYFTVSYENKL